MVGIDKTDFMFDTLVQDNDLSANLSEAFQAFDEQSTNDILDVILALEGNVTCLDPKERFDVDSTTVVLEAWLLPGVAVAGTLG